MNWIEHIEAAAQHFANEAVRHHAEGKPDEAHAALRDGSACLRLIQTIENGEINPPFVVVEIEGGVCIDVRGAESYETLDWDAIEDGNPIELSAAALATLSPDDRERIARHNARLLGAPVNA